MNRKECLKFIYDNQLDLRFEYYRNLQFHLWKSKYKSTDDFNLDNCRIISVYEEIQDFYDYIQELSEMYCCSFMEILKNNSACNYQKYKRLKNRLEKMFDTDMDYLVLFCTFTLNDDHINNDITYLRKSLTRYLKAHFSSYVANEDYGSQYERLHFHAVCLCPVVPGCFDEEKFFKNLAEDYLFGFTKFEKITVKNTSALSLYINKLVNHAKKLTNKRKVIIYSRD